MNKNLKQLLLEAEAYADYYFNIADEPEHEIFQRRFAELIIKECIKLAVFRGDTATAKKIKDHFEIYWE